jgi:DNA-binding LacI/PurR family transcriptional regulator
MELTVPLVVLQATSPPGVVTVGADQYGAARVAVRHLVESGHRRIVHLAGPRDSVDARERERGWRDELAAHHLVAQITEAGDWTPSSGYAIGAGLDPTQFSAVFAANDQMAVGLIHALSDEGFRVPDDVSVIGFDDIPEAAHISPPLTTLRQDFQRLGHDMLATLLAQIEGAPGPAEAEPSQPRLIVRSSTRAVNHAPLAAKG